VNTIISIYDAEVADRFSSPTESSQGWANWKGGDEGNILSPHKYY